MITIAGAILPRAVQAQSIGDDIYSMHGTLQNLFNEMLPMCSNLIVPAQAIAGFAALFFIASRVWAHIARAEPIDFYPLLRPFALGIAIFIFPYLISMINSVFQPLTDATAAMAKDSNKAVQYYVDQQEKQVMTQPETATSTGTGSPDQWAQYEQPTSNDSSSGFLGGVSSFFNIKNMVISFINQLLEVLYAAAGLAVDVIRTFYLIVLAIIGPVVLGLSVFDGFHHTLSHWVSRYIHVFMWLPVSNLFGAISSKILELMTVDGHVSIFIYMIFMVISIIGYTTVPSVAGYIMQPGGGSKDTLLHKATNAAAKVLPIGISKG